MTQEACITALELLRDRLGQGSLGQISPGQQQVLVGAGKMLDLEPESSATFMNWGHND